MDYNLKQLLFIITFVVLFGGLQGFYNIVIVSYWFFGVVVLIAITFFKKDLIISLLRLLFDKNRLKIRL